MQISSINYNYTYPKVSYATKPKTQTSFGGALRALQHPFKNLGDFELCERLIKKIYGQNAKFIPDPKSSIERFFITRENFSDDIAYGTLLYDSKNILKYLSIQELDPKCYISTDDNLKVFDMNGNLFKLLTAKQSETLRAYRGNLAKPMNAMLRFHPNNDFYEKYAKILDSLFANPISHNVTENELTVYRGLSIHADDPTSLFKELLSGRIFTERGYLSTTTNPERAKTFGNVFMKIKVPKGQKYLDMTMFTSPSEYFIREEELLFPRGTRLLPTSFDAKTGTFTVNMKQN